MGSTSPPRLRSQDRQLRGREATRFPHGVSWPGRCGSPSRFGKTGCGVSAAGSNPACPREIQPAVGASHQRQGGRVITAVELHRAAEKEGLRFDQVEKPAKSCLLILISRRSPFPRTASSRSSQRRCGRFFNSRRNGRGRVTCMIYGSYYARKRKSNVGRKESRMIRKPSPRKNSENGTGMRGKTSWNR